jgi:hypothetical protein
MAKLFAIWAGITIATCGAGVAWAERRPAVLELYTAEGCSSCPPAEAFIAELAQLPEVLPLSFHVDYWNDRGWRDVFTFADATHRQRVYADSMRQSSVYTPQAVIDGEKAYVGSDRRAILSALSQAREGPATRIALHDGQVNVSVAAQSGAKTSDVLLIGYLREATSQIGRGENAGRTHARSRSSTRCSCRQPQRAFPCLASTIGLARLSDCVWMLVPADGRGRPPREQDVSGRIDVPIMRDTARMTHPSPYSEHGQPFRSR